MLSLQECRLFLGMDCELTDAQIELLRDQLYALAHVALDAFREQQPSRIPIVQRQEAKDLDTNILDFDAGS